MSLSDRIAPSATWLPPTLTTSAVVRSLGAHAAAMGLLAAATWLWPHPRPDEAEQRAQIEIVVGTNARQTGSRAPGPADLPQPQPAPREAPSTSVPAAPAESKTPPSPADGSAAPPATSGALGLLSESPVPAPPANAEATPAAPPGSPGAGQLAPPTPQEPGKAGAPPEIRVGDGIAIAAAEIEGAGTVHPAKSETGNVPPEYPIEAARRGERGTVVLQISIAADGSVTRVSVLRSSGSELLDRAARDRIATWHFEPARRDGQPVPDVEEQSIRFLPE